MNDYGVLADGVFLEPEDAKAKVAVLVDDLKKKMSVTGDPDALPPEVALERVREMREQLRRRMGT